MKRMFFLKKLGDENGNYWEHDENPIKKRGTLFSDRPILDSSQKKTKTMAKVSFRSWTLEPRTKIPKKRRWSAKRLQPVDWNCFAPLVKEWKIRCLRLSSSVCVMVKLVSSHPLVSGGQMPMQWVKIPGTAACKSCARKLTRSGNCQWWKTEHKMSEMKGSCLSYLKILWRCSYS